MKRLSKNMISVVFSQLVSIITGLLVQRYILLKYGSDINGLTASVTQILSYLVLIEAGVSAASMQALYKPLVDGDNNKINAVLSATKQSFLKVGIVFFAALTGTSLVFPIIVRNQLDFLLVAAITFASGATNGAIYLFLNKYVALLHADNRAYCVYNANAFANILTCTIRILAIIDGLSVVFIQALVLIGVVFKGAFFCIYTKKHYPNVSFNSAPDFKAISKRKNVFIHQIAGFVHNHTDVLLITVFSTLKNVSLYSVYNLIYSHINSLLQSVFAQAPLGFLGKLYAKDKDEFKRAYDIYEIAYSFVLMIILTAAISLTIPFVRNYTSGVTDINYIDETLAWLFYIVQVFNLFRIPSITAMNVAGAYKETQAGAIIEAVINLGVSIPMFFVIGIKGLLMGTICAMLFRSTDMTLYNYKHIRETNMKRVFKLFCITVLPSGILAYLISSIFGAYSDSWIHWFIQACVTFSIVVIVYLLIFFFFYKREFKDIFKLIKMKIRRGSFRN